jgi:hypothetical protein
MFNAWLNEARLKQEQLNSATLNSVMERWKAKASTTRDLQAIADRWSRGRTLRRSWKEWFFRTCGVKTVQYYRIKLRQRTLALWAFKSRRIREMNRHALYKSRRKLLASAMARWESSTKTAIIQADSADNHLQNQVLLKYLRIWQTAQQLSLRAGLLKDRIDNRLMRSAWRRWRDTTYILLFQYNNSVR